MDAFVLGIYRIQFKFKLCKETITFCYENCHHIFVPGYMDVFIHGIYSIHFKCKLCKDNNVCYENFHHITVPGFMDAFVYGIYRIQLKCKLCKYYNICYESFVDERVTQCAGMWRLKILVLLYFYILCKF